jgi:hypothetical protein
MVLMCKTITDYTGDGAMPLLYSIRDCVPGAFELLLFGIFILLFGGNYLIMTSRTGRTKILIALLASSFFTTILSLFLALGQLVQFITVITFSFLTIIIFILFLLSDNS